jgi:outer membrane lipoprotein-sorting protein
VDAGTATNWLEQVTGAWRLVAGQSRGVDVRYSDFAAGRPATIRLRTTQGAPTDLTIRLSQVDVNQPLEPAVFEVDVPPGAKPMTLKELREAGPLGR